MNKLIDVKKPGAKRPRCPVCDSVNTKATGLSRQGNGGVLEARECNACGSRWNVDDSGQVY